MYFAIDTPDVAKLEQIISAYFEENEGAGNWFALIDAAFDYERRSLKWRDETWPVYHLQGYAALSEASPTFLALDTQNHENLKKQLKRLLAHCAGIPMLSFIHSKLTADQIREYWQSSLTPLTDDGQRMLLRFADTRICEKLPSALLPSSWSRYTAVLEQWLIIDRTGTLKPLHFANENQMLEPLSVWELTSQEFNALLNNGQPDALIDALSEHFAELVPEQNRANFYQTISEVCNLADKYKIEAFSELMSLALAVITSETPMQHDIKLNNWLAAHSWKKGEFDDALIQFLESL